MPNQIEQLKKELYKFNWITSNQEKKLYNETLDKLINAVREEKEKEFEVERPGNELMMAD